MIERRQDFQIVTLSLQDGAGRAWSLRLSADCMRFIGAYRRVEGFNIDAMALFDGAKRSG
ncbi:hypothetical protein [Sphingobium sp.]|uniref:hypothetical protein n=1 Tax=Sphingobium sp. TaxID=1912891 RepID=UPI003BB48CEB